MLAWPFSSRGARVETTARTPSDLPEFEAFKSNDAVLRCWLPDELLARLDWLSVDSDLSRPDVIRALVFQHLYGQVAYQSLLAKYKRSPATVAPVTPARATTVPAYFPQPIDTEGDIRRSTKRYSVDAAIIGAASTSFKLELPQKMKVDLEELAREELLTPSESLRKLMVLELLGGIRYAKWRDALERLTSENSDGDE